MCSAAPEVVGLTSAHWSKNNNRKQSVFSPRTAGGTLWNVQSQQMYRSTYPTSWATQVSDLVQKACFRATIGVALERWRCLLDREGLMKYSNQVWCITDGIVVRGEPPSLSVCQHKWICFFTILIILRQEIKIKPSHSSNSPSRWLQT